MLAPGAIKRAYNHRLYESVFGTPNGKKVLKQIVNQCGVYSVAKASSEYEAGINEGMRRVAVSLLLMVHKEVEEKDEKEMVQQ